MTDLALADERERQIYSNILIDPNAKCSPRGSQELGRCYHGDIRTSQREVISSLEEHHIKIRIPCGMEVQIRNTNSTELFCTGPYRVDMKSLFSWRSWDILNLTDSRFF